ncbi:MAG TPA: hypothetical protein VGD80_27025 [Kofleriaceae bacterium]
MAELDAQVLLDRTVDVTGRRVLDGAQLQREAIQLDRALEGERARGPSRGFCGVHGRALVFTSLSPVQRQRLGVGLRLGLEREREPAVERAGLGELGVAEHRRAHAIVVRLEVIAHRRAVGADQVDGSQEVDVALEGLGLEVSRRGGGPSYERAAG